MTNKAQKKSPKSIEDQLDKLVEGNKKMAEKAVTAINEDKHGVARTLVVTLGTLPTSGV